jgi:hypothetical protein
MRLGVIECMDNSWMQVGNACAWSLVGDMGPLQGFLGDFLLLLFSTVTPLFPKYAEPNCQL